MSSETGPEKNHIDSTKLEEDTPDLNSNQDKKHDNSYTVEPNELNDKAFGKVQEVTTESSQGCMFVKASTDLKTETDDVSGLETSDNSKKTDNGECRAESKLVEQARFYGQCKLYRYAGKAKGFVERGEGNIYILPTEGSKMDRILMIREGLNRLGCNHFIHPSRELMKHSAKNSFIWSTDTDTCEADTLLSPKQIFVVRFKEDAKADDFKSKFDESRERNRMYLLDKDNNKTTPLDPSP